MLNNSYKILPNKNNNIYTVYKKDRYIVYPIKGYVEGRAGQGRAKKKNANARARVGPGGEGMGWLRGGAKRYTKNVYYDGREYINEIKTHLDDIRGVV